MGPIEDEISTPRAIIQDYLSGNKKRAMKTLIESDLEFEELIETDLWDKNKEDILRLFSLAYWTIKEENNLIGNQLTQLKNNLNQT